MSIYKLNLNELLKKRKTINDQMITCLRFITKKHVKM